MLDRLCKSAPFLDSLDFKCLVGDNIYHIKPEWDDRALPYPQIQEEETYRDELDRYIEVKGVDLTPHSYLFLSQLVNLRVLHIRRAVRNPIGMPFEYDLGLTKLESVRIHKITPDFDIKQFLSSSAATIRDLQVPYNFVFDLDLSDYPQLNRLELTMYGVDQYKAWTQGEPEEFWRRVEHCTNLVTLAFAYEQISKEVAAKLFGRGGGFGVYTPPSVRRIDITDDYSLDNVADIIYNGNVEQLGITLGRYEQSVRDEVVRLMCKDQKVELIHVPNPNIYVSLIFFSAPSLSPSLIRIFRDLIGILIPAKPPLQFPIISSPHSSLTSSQRLSFRLRLTRARIVPAVMTPR